MKVAVLQKIVVDTYAVPQISEDGTEISFNANAEWVDDRHSEFAIEEAVRVKEKLGDVSIKTFSIRPKKLDKPILKALAKGIDEALVIDSEELYHADPQLVGKALAAELKEYDPDLIISGTESSDVNNFLVSSVVAAELGMPIITAVRKLDVTTDGFTASRSVGSRKETYEGSYPVMITTHKALNEPRYPKLPMIMKAKRKPKEVKDEGQVAIENKITQVNVRKQEINKEVTMIDGEIDEQVNKLIEFLVNEEKVIQ